jgi:hypothetical protein
MWILEDAIKVSCARCAAVSFRNVDYGLEKSEQVYERLVGDERKHASAFEHCGTPMDEGSRQRGRDMEHRTFLSTRKRGRMASRTWTATATCGRGT